MAINNNGNRLDDAGNVAVDFVWGNMPMQPNDERGDSANAIEVTIQNANAAQDKSWSAVKKFQSGRLDFAKGPHDIAQTEYAGFPSFTGNNDGAYVSGTVYLAVPSVLGLTTALAVDALKDAGYASANITTASAATNSPKTVTAISRTAGSKDLVFTASGAGAAYPVGTKVTVSGFSGDDLFLNGTYTVTANATNSFTVQTAATDAVALTGKSGAVAGTAGTIKTQSTAANAANVAASATITITPWA